MTRSERDASVGAIKDALGVCGALAAYPRRRETMLKKLAKIAGRRGIGFEVADTIRHGSTADLYALRRKLLGAQIPGEE